MRALIVLSCLAAVCSSCSRKRSEETPLTAAESLKSMRLSEDFHVELFASEPQVMSPVEMVFDEEGRIYVAEMLDYPDDPPPGKPSRSRIRMLVDADGDGRPDRVTVFADHVLAVSGIMPWKGGLIVPSAPDILYLKDENGDGVADTRKVLYTGFPRVNQEGRITNPRLGVDNWIYLANSGADGKITSPGHPEAPPLLVRGADFRFDPIGGRAEAASGPTQYGTGIDDWGNRFITQNTTHIRHVVVPMDYLARAPLLEVRAVAQDISDHGRPSAPMFPLTGPQEWRKQRTALRQQRYDENKLNRTEQLAGWFTAASGGTVYLGDAFPREYAGNVFTGDVSGNLIHRDILRPDGATFLAARAKDGVEFLASTDIWFRPCNFANAPDGALYITDIYRHVIETPESIPEEIRKKIDFYKGDTMGRIYRIVPNKPLRTGNLKPGLGRLNSPELVAQLANPNGWHRFTAHRLLLERQDRSVVPELEKMAANPTSPEGRSHALWLLRALGSSCSPALLTALHDADPRVRGQAIRAGEPCLAQSKPVAEASWRAAADPDPHVQFQAALTLGQLDSAQSFQALLGLAHQRSADPWFRVALLSSVANSPSRFFHALLAKGETWSDGQLLADLSALIGARQDRGELARWFAALPSSHRPEILLGGLTRGLRLVGNTRLQVAGAEAVLARILNDAPEPVQQAAWEASRYFALDSLVRKAAVQAADPGLPAAKRVGAIRALRGAAFASAAPVLRSILQSHAPAEVESGAIDSLAAFDDPGVAPAILEHWRSYSPEGRKHAVAALLAQSKRASGLLAAIEEGRIEPSALDPAARSRLYDNPDPAIAKKAKSLLESSNSDRAKVVSAYHDAVNLRGDVARGKKLFDDNCAKCHMPRRSGGRVGPDLSGINNKSKEELLTSILNPSYAIEPRFVNYLVTTRDGRMYDGVIANETPGAITLRGGSEEGDETILRKNVADIRASSVSLMPDGLEDNLKKQDLADVIAYLRGGL